MFLKNIEEEMNKQTRSFKIKNKQENNSGNIYAKKKRVKYVFEENILRIQIGKADFQILDEVLDLSLFYHYLTVTHFARFLGLSGSHPRRTAS